MARSCCVISPFILDNISLNTEKSNHFKWFLFIIHGLRKPIAAYWFVIEHEKLYDKSIRSNIDIALENVIDKKYDVFFGSHKWLECVFNWFSYWVILCFFFWWFSFFSVASKSYDKLQNVFSRNPLEMSGSE